jgi:hypothetical protein
LVSSSSSSSSSVESKRTAVYSSPIERVVISKGPRTNTHVRRLSRLENFCLLFFLFLFFVDF